MNGDNDPLDVCEIGSRIPQRGSVIQVKVLGALGLIDEGEADWKILAINTDDPLVHSLNDVQDVEKHMPGLLEATSDWFRVYKIPAGKPANTLANNGRFYSADFARELIAHDHKLWWKLMRNGKNTTSEKARKISLSHTSEIKGAEDQRIDVEKARSLFDVEIEAKTPDKDSSQCSDDIDTIHYVDRTNL